jgi:large subunit ribosomal protein L25
MREVILNAQVRGLNDQHGLKVARKNGLIPGIFYRKDIPNIPFFVKDLSLKKIIYSSSVTVVDLTFEDNKKYPCIVKDVQYDPITDQPVHCDFIGVFEDQAILVEVPVSFSGIPVGQKDGGLTQQMLHKVRVECLPRFIPESIAIDITPLNIGDSVHVRDLKIENVTFKEREDATIVSVVPPTVEVVATPAEGAEVAEGAETAEPEVVSGKGKKEEAE